MNDGNPIGNGVRGKEGDLITPPTISDYDAPSGKDGYIFGGWSNTPDGTDDFRNEDGKIMINHSIQTYYAIWNAPQQPDPETPEGGE